VPSLHPEGVSWGTLVASGGEAHPSICALDRHQITLGRAPDCDPVVADIQISRHHAQIWRQGSGAMLQDLGSRNGAFVNGQCIARPTALQPGDTVTLGTVQVRLTLAGAPAQATSGSAQLVLARGRSRPTAAGELMAR